jgi:hypothetical protein
MSLSSQPKNSRLVCSSASTELFRLLGVAQATGETEINTSIPYAGYLGTKQIRGTSPASAGFFVTTHDPNAFLAFINSVTSSLLRLECSVSSLLTNPSLRFRIRYHTSLLFPPSCSVKIFCFNSRKESL